MSAVFSAIRNVLRYHKLKIGAFFTFISLFLVLSFPYGDLGNLLTTTVYDASQQQVYLHARDLNLALFPVPGISASEVTLEPGARGARFAPLQLEELEVRPLLSALLAFRGGASVSGEGLFGGEVDISAKMTSSIFSNTVGPIEISDFGLEDVQLAAILDYLAQNAGQQGGSGMKIGGKLGADSNGLRIDPTFKEPIKGDLNLQLTELTLPTRIPVQGFAVPLEIPQIKIGRSEIQTQWDNNKVKISKGVIGGEKDPLSARLFGELELRPIPGGGMSFGSFSFCIETSAKPDFYANLLKQLPILEPLIQKFRLPGDGVRYGIRASGFDVLNFAQWQLVPGDCKTMTAAP